MLVTMLLTGCLPVRHYEAHVDTTKTQMFVTTEVDKVYVSFNVKPEDPASYPTAPLWGEPIEVHDNVAEIENLRMRFIASSWEGLNGLNPGDRIHVTLHELGNYTQTVGSGSVQVTKVTIEYDR